MRKAEDVLARTVWGEARGEGVAGMAAVAMVVINRAKKPGWWGRGIEEICRRKRQFSCWNDDDPNRSKLATIGAEDRRFAQAMAIAELAQMGALADFTDGATHYHAREVLPKWAEGKDPCLRLGGHLFYRGIE